MQFDCPRCGTVGAGVLLFNLVSPCDKCLGYTPTPSTTKSSDRFQMVTSVELRNILKTHTPKRIAFGCGSSLNQSFITAVKKLVDASNLSDEPPGFYWDTEGFVAYADDYDDDKLHVIEWR